MLLNSIKQNTFILQRGIDAEPDRSYSPCVGSATGRSRTGVKTMMLTTYVKKIDLTVDRDSDRLPEVSREHVMAYGWNKLLADCHAGVKRENYGDGEPGERAFQADVRAKVDARLAQIDAGDFARTRTTDPATAKARALAAKMSTAGIDIEALVAAAEANPEKLAAFLKRQAEQGRAA
jgi:hypothetical protein